MRDWSKLIQSDQRKISETMPKGAIFKEAIHSNGYMSVVYELNGQLERFCYKDSARDKYIDPLSSKKYKDSRVFVFVNYRGEVKLAAEDSSQFHLLFDNHSLIGELNAIQR